MIITHARRVIERKIQQRTIENKRDTKLLSRPAIEIQWEVKYVFQYIDDGGSTKTLPEQSIILSEHSSYDADVAWKVVEQQAAFGKNGTSIRIVSVTLL